MKKKVILAIGAHPDDIEIGCGGTIKSFASENAKIYFIVATLGEKCIVKSKLLDIIDENKDSLRFYNIGNNYESKIEHYGAKASYAPEDPLIF